MRRAIIILAMIVIAAALFERFFSSRNETREPPIEIVALRIQCDEKHGLLAISTTDQWTWVECRRNQKRIWASRLQPLDWR
jgi:hypothetical protein